MAARTGKSSASSAGRRRANGARRHLGAAGQRRERILRLTTPLFLKRGYDNVSIDDIVGVVGGSKATIYAWFGSKEGLFKAVVRRKCQEVTLAIDIDCEGSLERQLTRIGLSFLQRTLSPPILEFHRLMVSIGRTFPQASRLFFEAGPVAAYSLVAAWIARRQSEGRIIHEDPHRLAVLFLDMLIGEHQLGRLTGMPRAAHPEAIEATVRIAVRVFLRGVRVRP